MVKIILRCNSQWSVIIVQWEFLCRNALCVICSILIQLACEGKQCENEISTSSKNEITPRKDDRDPEVIKFNTLLDNFSKHEDDITVAVQSNLRDSSWSNYRDEKHIHPDKIGIYAANIIRALKIAYKITDKRELFEENLPENAFDYRRNGKYYIHGNEPFFQHNGNTKKTTLETMANYYPSRHYHPPYNTPYYANNYQNSNNYNFKPSQRNSDILVKIDALRKCLLE